MYQKYHTEGLILGSRDTGESDRTIAIFTRDFGLVRARASAVRSEKSKMRYAAQDYSRSYVSLVKGKRGWRLAGCTAISIAQGDPRGIAAFARISELVMRLVNGEDTNEYLFAALAEAHTALMSSEGGPSFGGQDAYGTIEIVCVARALYALGYLSNEALSSALFTHTAYTGEHLLEAETMKDRLLLSINKAIAETHL